MRPLTPEFSFAGFTWPRYVATLAIGPAALRKQRETRKVCGGYYHAPRPNANDGRGFYLASDGQPCDRWEWADSGTLFYCDDFGGDTTMRGILLLLPHGRFLAGWAMGEHMAACVESQVFTDRAEASRYADECARIAAENEREYQAQEAERIESEEREAAEQD